MKEVIATFIGYQTYTYIYYIHIDGSTIRNILGSIVIERFNSYKELNIILSQEQEDKINAHLATVEKLRKATDKEV